MKKKSTKLFTKLNISLLTFLSIFFLSTFAYAENVYTLKDTDVGMQDGIIQYCTYNSDYYQPVTVIIPSVLQGQTVVGIIDGTDTYNGVFANKTITKIHLPNTIKSIGDYAFYNNDIVEIVFQAPSIIERIGVMAFSRNELTSVDIPFSVKFLGVNSFRDNKISSLNFSDSSHLQHIGCYAFHQNKITEVVIPSTVIMIDYNAFASNLITKVIFKSNSSILHIGKDVFSYNPLTSFTLPLTHSNTNFSNWINSTNQHIDLGTEIYDFSTYYTTSELYSLKNEDVTVLNGVITDWNKLLPYKRINIPSVLKGEVITGVGNGVFYSCELVEVKLPVSIVEIGSNSFHFNYLTELLLPKNIKKIGDSAFDSNKISNLNFEAGIGSFTIGMSAFRSNNLESIILPNSVSSIGETAFNSNKLNKVEIADNSVLAFIGANAFSQNSSLVEIILPTHSSVPQFAEWVSNEAYIGGTNKKLFLNGGDKITLFDLQYTADIYYTLTLSDVVISKGVISKFNVSSSARSNILIPSVLNGEVVTEIANGNNTPTGVFIFKNIRTLVLPNTLTSIGAYAFYGNQLKRIVLPDSIRNIGDYAFYWNYIEEVVIPKSVVLIGKNAFGKNSLTKVEIEENSNIQSIMSGAFASNSGLTTFSLPNKHSQSNFRYLVNNNGYTFALGATISDFSLFYQAPYILKDEDVVVNNSVLESCSYNFANKDIAIPDTLDGQQITDISMKGASNSFRSKLITSVQLPSKLVVISDSTFYGNSLKRLSIPETMVSIGSGAFNTNKLNNVAFSEKGSLLYMGPAVFSNNIDLLSFKLPLTHTNVDFTNWLDDLSKAIMPGATILKINYGISLTTNIPYVINDNDVSIKDGVIDSCYRIIPYKNIIIPSVLHDQKVIGIASKPFGSGVFKGQALCSVKLPSTLEFIGNNAFKDNKISELDIPITVEVIGDAAFQGNKLKSINIPSNVKTIGKSAFNNNQLSNVIFDPNSSINMIDVLAFGSNQLSEGFLLPILKSSDFSYWFSSANTTVSSSDLIKNFSLSYFPRFKHTLTDEDVEVIGGEIVSCSYNFKCTDITIPPVLDGQVIRSIKGGFYDKTITDIHLPNSLFAIQSYCFYSNQIRSVVIPASVKYISNSAFESNRILSNGITIEENTNLTFIGSSAFFNNHLLSIKIPKHSFSGFEKFKDESGNIFKENDSITNFFTSYRAELPYTLCDYDVIVEEGEIRGVLSISKNIIIPSYLDGQSIVGIGDNAFSVPLNTVELPSTLKRIGEDAFRATGLSSITLPPNLTEIGPSAFLNNYLQSITIPSSVISIGSSAFRGNEIHVVTIPSNVRELGDLAFNSFGVNRNLTISFEGNSQLISCGAQKETGSLLQVGYLPTLDSSLGINEWVDSEGVIYHEGSELPTKNVTLNKFYTLKDEDVVVVDGEIQSVSWNFEYKNIEIPSMLDGQIIKKINCTSGYTQCFREKGLKNIVFPSTLEAILKGFEGNELTKLIIPKSVKEIGKYAFSSCNLKEVVFEANSSLLYIGEGAFSLNKDLASITLPTTHSNPSINKWYDSNGNDFLLGDQITNFVHCYEGRVPYVLTDNDVEVLNGTIISTVSSFPCSSIIIPNILDNQLIIGIGDEAFYRRDISSVKFPESIKNIGRRAFSSCKLTSLYFPSSIISINSEAFSGVITLEKVEFESNSNLIYIGNEAFSFNDVFKSYYFPTTHVNSSFEFWNYVQDPWTPTKVTLKSVGYLGYYSANIPYTLSDYDVEMKDGFIISARLLSECQMIKIPEVLDGEPVIGISDDVFAHKGLFSVLLPSTLKYIGRGAFSNNYVSEIVLPESVIAIGEFAFYSNSLAKIEIPKNVISIGKSAFEFNKSLYEVIFEDNSSIITIGCGAFNNCYSNYPVILPAHHSDPAFQFFEDQNGIKYLANSITTDRSIAYFTNTPYVLTNDDVVVKDGIIDSCLVSYFNNGNIIIPDILDDQIIIGIADKSGNQGVFSSRGIVHLKLPTTIEFIGKNSFAFNQIGVLKIPSSVIRIGESSFTYNETNTVTLESGSKLTYIERSAFFNSPSTLKTIFLPQPKIGSPYKKWYTGNPNVIYYDGQSISFNCYSYCVREDVTYTLEDKDVIVENGVIMECNYNFDVKRIIIPSILDGQTVVGIANSVNENGIFSNKSLRSIELPSSLVSIGDYSFFKNNISELTIPQGAIKIGKYAFSRNVISSISLGEYVNSIGQHAFSSNKLVSLSIPNGVDSIGDYAFSNNQLANLDFSSDSELNYIGDYAFSHNRLVNVLIPSNVKFVGDYAFSYNKLTRAIFEDGSSIHTVGQYAFYFNPSLSAIKVPTFPLGSSSYYLNDDYGKSYQIGDLITDYKSGYNVNEAYILTDEDVIVVDGVIVSCNYSFSNKDIIIPSFLDGQDVIGIASKTNGEGVFQARGIKAVLLSTPIKDIGDYAFDSNSIKYIFIPSSVDSICQNAFSNNEITNIVYENRNSSVRIKSSSIYLKESNLLDSQLLFIQMSAFENNLLTSLLIPNFVSSIESSAFAKNKLINVSFESQTQLSYIGGSAFNDNIYISNITLPIPNKAGYDFIGWEDENGFMLVNNSLTINSQGFYIPSFSEIINYNVTFVVITSSVYDNGIAKLYFNNQEYHIINGKAIIPNIIPGTYTYSVAKDGFDTYYGSLSVVEESVSVNVYFITTNQTISEFSVLSVFPNPFTSSIEIEVSSNRVSNIEIRNSLGFLIKTFNWEGNLKQTLDLDDCPKGMLIIKINNSNGGYAIKKVIKI